MPVLTVNTKRELGKKAQSSNIAAGKVGSTPVHASLPRLQHSICSRLRRFDQLYSTGGIYSYTSAVSRFESLEDMKSSISITFNAHAIVSRAYFQNSS